MQEQALLNLSLGNWLFFFLPSPLGFRQVDPHAIFACSMFAVIVALEFIHLGEMGKRPC